MISIIIPMKNEEKNCRPLFRSIRSAVRKNRWKAEIIFVDDASSDRTAVVLDHIAKNRAGVRVVHRTQPSGPGRAIRDGLKIARGSTIVTMDGDLSHDPAEMKKLVAALSDADIACGSRALGGAEMQKSRVVISSLYNFLFRTLIGIPVHDFTSGYRAYRSAALKSLGLDAKMFGIYVEIPIKAHIKGFRFAEVPIHYRKRVHGSTNLSYLKQGKEYLKYALWGVWKRMGG